MTTTYKLALALSTTMAAALIAAAPARAQEAAADAPFATTDIIVTAQKREQNLQDVPVAISVVSGEESERIPAWRLTRSIPALPSASTGERS